jgi:hypothetical protein
VTKVSSLLVSRLRFLLCLDAVILLLHLLLGSQSEFFHLDFEQNLPTYYQGFKLVFIGVLGALMLVFRKPKKLQLPWSFLAGISVLLVAVGLDEMFQVHENIYRLFENTPWLHPSNVVSFSESLGFRSSLWLLYYSPALLLVTLWMGYWLRELQLKKLSEYRILLASIVCFFLVICMEVLSSTGEFWDWQYQVLVFIEEGSEILGGTFLAAFLLSETDLSQEK